MTNAPTTTVEEKTVALPQDNATPETVVPVVEETPAAEPAVETK